MQVLRLLSAAQRRVSTDPATAQTGSGLDPHEACWDTRRSLAQVHSGAAGVGAAADIRGRVPGGGQHGGGVPAAGAPDDGHQRHPGGASAAAPPVCTQDTSLKGATSVTRSSCTRFPPARMRATVLLTAQCSWQDAQAETNASFEEFMAESTKAEWASAKRQLFDALLPRGAGGAAARLDGMSLSPTRPTSAFASPFRVIPAGASGVQVLLFLLVIQGACSAAQLPRAVVGQTPSRAQVIRHSRQAAQRHSSAAGLQATRRRSASSTKP